MVLQVVQWNCRSIYGKHPKLKHYLSQLAPLPDLLCLQETHLSCKYQPQLPRYTILRKDRPPHFGKSGELCICVKHSIAYTQVTIPSQHGVETVGIKINDVHIFNVYNPPNNNLDTTILNQMVRHKEGYYMRRF